MSSTQRLQDYIDSLKQARLQAASNPTALGLQHMPVRPEPRDVLELEFMDSLDQRMEQLERSLAKNHSATNRSDNSHAYRNAAEAGGSAIAADGINSSGSGWGGIISPAPAPTHFSAAVLSPHRGQGQSTTTAGLLMQQRAVSPHLVGGSATAAQLGARRGFMWSSAQPHASRSFNAHVVPPASLVFRVTIPFMRTNVNVLAREQVTPPPGGLPSQQQQQLQHQQQYAHAAPPVGSSSECATFQVHVADVSQTGDDLLWHIVAQARIRFPDLMQVGGFEWTPGAASSLCLFALCAQDAANWAATPNVGTPRIGGAFLHYDSATPVHRYQPIAEAIRKRRERPQSATELMSRTVRDMPQAPDVEVFVLLRTMVPSTEFSEVSLRRGLAVQ